MRRFRQANRHRRFAAGQIHCNLVAIQVAPLIKHCPQPRVDAQDVGVVPLRAEPVIWMAAQRHMIGDLRKPLLTLCNESPCPRQIGEQKRHPLRVETRNQQRWRVRLQRSNQHQSSKCMVADRRVKAPKHVWKRQRFNRLRHRTFLLLIESREERHYDPCVAQ